MDKAMTKAAGEMSAPTERRKLIDLEEIVKRCSFNEFKNTTSKRKHKKLKFDALNFEINWEKVKFEHDDPVYTPVNQSTGSPTHQVPGQILFKTQFNNNTKEVQEYSFKTERTTTSTCTVAIEKGVCYGAELSLNIKTPCEVLEAGATFSREVEFQSTNETTKEQTVTWSVDSQIKVRAGCNTLAKLVVEEKSDIRDYKIQTCMYGEVSTQIFYKKDNSYIANFGSGLYEMFLTKHVTDEEKNSVQILSKSDPRNRWSRPVIVYESKGRCEFKFGVEQRVELSEEEITGDKSEAVQSTNNNNN